jgi:hypothetical protein
MVSDCSKRSRFIMLPKLELGPNAGLVQSSCNALIGRDSAFPDLDLLLLYMQRL